MKITKLLIIVLVLAFQNYCFTQSLSLSFGGPEDEESWSITGTIDKGFLITATTRSFGQGAEDILLLKLDQSGLLQWTKTIGTSHRNRIYRTITTSDGGFAMIGSGYQEQKNISDIHFIKLNKYYDIEFEQYYLDSPEDEGYGVEELLNGYLITGFTRKKGIGDFFIIKTDQFGNEIWRSIYGEDSKDIAIGSSVAEDGNYFIYGMRSGFNGYSSFDFKKLSSDIMIMKLDKDNGDTLFKRVYETRDHDLINQVIKTKDGVYLIGSSQNGSVGSFDVLVVKVDSKGEIEWRSVYGGPSYDYGMSAIIKGDNLYVLGSSNSYNSEFLPDIYVLNLELNGNVIWDNYFPKSGSQYGIDISVNNEQIAVVGQSKTTENEPSDLYFAFLDFQGNFKEIPIAEELKKGVIVFPNPANIGLRITRLVDNVSLCSNEIFIYKIFNSKGTLIQLHENNSNTQFLNTEDYAAGAYHYEVQSKCYSKVSGSFIIAH